MKTLIIMLLVAYTASLKAQPGKFVIEGEVAKLTKDVKVYLSIPGLKYIDSTVISNSKFRFEGEAGVKPELAGIVIMPKTASNQMKGAQWLYVEKGLIKFKTDALRPNETTISGTPANNDFMVLKSTQKPLGEKFAKVQKDLIIASAKNGGATLKEKSKELALLQKRLEKSTEDFIKSHPQSVVSIMCLEGLVRVQDVTKLNKLFNSLSPALKNSASGVNLQQKIGKSQIAVQIGSTAPDFTLKNTKDRLIRLSSLRGQYVLIDFWASWCGPCRLENPNLVKCYQLYKQKNFTILGVSGDGDKSKWLAAVGKDGLRWTNVVVNKKDKMNNAIALYHISSWPQNFLLDPMGKVIAKNLRGDALNAKLAEILGKTKTE